MARKKRLDQLLVERGFFSSRSQAKRVIMAGRVYVDDSPVDKAGTGVTEGAAIRIKGELSPYVSRGGLKLEKALEVFRVDPVDKTAIDIGASTGGFTDCLLQHGARRVYAVDVGYGQLAWKLRQDERVVVMERTNFRYLTPEELPLTVPLIVTDVSFISLRLIIPPAVSFLSDGGEIVALVKPQFEAGPERVGKNGVVRDPVVHRDVLRELHAYFNGEGLFLKGLDYSPITGASSNNIEYLICLERRIPQDNDSSVWQERIAEVVQRAQEELGRG